MVVIILDGILEKRGNAVVKVFKERYCAILDEHGQLSFVYWKSKGHKYPKGSIKFSLIHNARSCLAFGKHCFQIELKDEGRIYWFKTKTEEEKKKWLQTLRECLDKINGTTTHNTPPQTTIEQTNGNSTPPVSLQVNDQSPPIPSRQPHPIPNQQSPPIPNQQPPPTIYPQDQPSPSVYPQPIQQFPTTAYPQPMYQQPYPSISYPQPIMNYPQPGYYPPPTINLQDYVAVPTPQYGYSVQPNYGPVNYPQPYPNTQYVVPPNQAYYLQTTQTNYPQTTQTNYPQTTQTPQTQTKKI